MSENDRIRIKGWEKFQHYKNRKPPWIKLYRDLIDDMEFYALSGDAAKTLVLLWVIASEADGYLPDIKVLAFRLRITENKCKSMLSELKHYLDITMLADCLHDATPEKEREVEKETKKRKKEYTLQFSELWTAYGMKGSKSVSFKRWESLTEAEKEQAAKAIKPYLLETPEKQYRKDFERYLSQKVFEGVLERDAAGQLNVPTNKQAGEDIFAGINWEQA